tara:strand:+ start:2035 stop:2796 length:762 start_codon:yes stop_codon:yes gene_type:complete
MNKTFTTPKGVAHFPYISQPDTKFDEAGVYKVNLCLPKEEAEPVIKLINAEIVGGIKGLMEKSKKEVKQAPVPYHDEVDEDTGQPTGNVIIKFKSKAAWKPAVFDSKGNMMTSHNIYGGSVIKVNGSIAFYSSPSIGAGATLRLRAVQIIEYVEGADGATKFGFDSEDGFTIEEPVAESEAPASPPAPAAVAVTPTVVPDPTPPAPVAPEAEKPAPAPAPVAEEPKAAPVSDSSSAALADEITALMAEVADDG